MQVQINNLRKEITEETLQNIENLENINKDILKLEKNLIQSKNYIIETCKWQEHILKNTEYISNEGKVTLKGRCCSSINESDSFLTTEYLTSLFERIDSTGIYPSKSCISFIVGSLIDEKELNKDDEGLGDISDIYKELGATDHKEVTNEMKYLKNKYEELHSEERLRDMNYNMTPVFGCYVYLWTIEKNNFNSIQEKMCNELYEGNFVRSMLKVYNICEEWKNISEIYQKPEFSNIIEEIQKEIIRDIVVVDSLYIAS